MISLKILLDTKKFTKKKTQNLNLLIHKIPCNNNRYHNNSQTLSLVKKKKRGALEPEPTHLENDGINEILRMIIIN